MGKKLTDEELKAMVAKNVKDNSEKDWDKASKAERNAADEMSGYWESGK